MFFYYSNPGIPKLYIDAGRKRNPVSHKLPDTELFDEQANSSKDMYVPPIEVREIIHQLENEKELDDVLNDEQREVMEDIWLKADEMGK